MKIEKALLALRNGYSIYNSSWEDGLWLTIINGNLVDQDGEKATLEISNIYDDWYICDLHLFSEFQPKCRFSLGEITPRYKVIFSNDDFFVYVDIYKETFIQTKYNFEDFAIKVNIFMKG